MSVRVLYFGRLRETLGKAEDTVPIEASVRAIALWERLNGDIPLPEHTLVAVNLEYVKADAVVSDGDELAFFPPVTGG